LRYLGLACTSIETEFLQALVRPESGGGLLPQLTALSLAGHDSISAGTIRDVVWSRLPEADRPRPRTSQHSLKRQPSAFAGFMPTAPAPKKAKKSSSSPSEPTPTSGSLPCVESEGCIPASQIQMGTIPSKSNVASITWLNLDGCERIEPSAVQILRQKVRFVSFFMGKIDEVRARGQGKWAWDADWLDSCGPDGERSCHVRRVPGTSGKDERWYVHHVCSDAPDTKPPLSQSIDSSQKWGEPVKVTRSV